MLSVYLLRHGETSMNADGNRYCGRTDIGLTEKGEAQARQVRDQLKGLAIDQVYSSPLQRAYLTASIASGNREVMKDERLIEVDFGIWEGKTREEFIAEEPAIWHAWCADPEHAPAGGNGETAGIVVKRVDDFFKEAFEKHKNGNIMVVGHNGINRLYLAYKLGMPLKDYRKIVQENSSITLFTLDEQGDISLKLLNCSYKIDHE